MELIPEQFYQETRSLQQIQEDTLLVQKAHESNIKRFNVKSTASQKKQQPIQDKIFHVIRKANLGNGWFCNYTDNIDSHTYFKYQQVVLTLHGCPGDYKDWNRIEGAIGRNYIRWINFFIPGFDGEDERRGDYKGTLEDLCLMLIKLLNNLKLNKVILLGHSLGSFIVYRFALLYPERLAAIIFPAGASIDWHVGMEGFYKSMVMSSKLNYSSQCRYWFMNYDPFRRYFHKKYDKNIPNFKFSSPLGDIFVPKMDQYSIMAALKIFCSFNNGWGQVYQYTRSIPPFLKFYAYGKEDPIIQSFVAERGVCYYTYRERAIKKEKNFNITKDQVKKVDELKDIDLNLENIQENFIFMFNNTGHSVHKRRGAELGKPIRCFIAVVDLIEKSEKEMPKL